MRSVQRSVSYTLLVLLVTTSTPIHYMVYLEVDTVEVTCTPQCTVLTTLCNRGNVVHRGYTSMHTYTVAHTIYTPTTHSTPVGTLVPNSACVVLYSAGVLL